MNASAVYLLEEIGRQLDLEIFPIVRNEGFVSPGQPSVSLITPGEEQSHAETRTAAQRPAAHPWSGPPRRSRPPRGPGAPVGPGAAGQAAPLSRSPGPVALSDRLSSLTVAYPQTRVWEQTEGLWILAQSALLPGLGRSAAFLIAVVPRRQLLSAWGFWSGGVAGSSWIGPRHTNYFDGSICAFDEQDGTWAFGDSLVDLVDMYSIWATRHLHLERFGWWPGPQSSAHPYERLMEFSDREHCGCGARGSRYGVCCKPKDLARDRIADALRFCNFTGWSVRKPPFEVTEFVRTWTSPPSLAGREPAADD